MPDLNERISEPVTSDIIKPIRNFTDTLPPGTLLRGHSYQIQQIIGRGSFGITYSATHTFLGNTVAIKEYFPSQYVTRKEGHKVVVSSPEYEKAYKNGLQQFIQEGQILAKITHPNIVQVRDLFEEGETAYLVMDLVNGHSLSKELESQVGFKLPVSRVVVIVEQIIAALTTLHEARIYHLDLKPQNILLTSSDKVILIDFGAARWGANTNQGVRSFTEAYAPPELTTGGKLGVYSDIFEVGMVLHQMLKGTLPPPSLKRITEKELWQPRALEEPWMSLIVAALALNPQERPQTIEQWWEGYSNFGQKTTQEIEEEPISPELAMSRFTSPLLQSAGMQCRLSRGCLREVFPVGSDYLLVCSSGGAALITLNNGAVIWEIDSPTEQVAFNAQKSLLALAWQQKIYLWNIETGQLLHSLQGHNKAILAIAISPNGEFVVSTSVDETVFLWDLSRPGEKKLLSLDYTLISCLTFSSDGRYLALGTFDGHLKLWQMENVEPYKDLLGHQKSIESLAFSYDNRLIASGGKDGLICLWKVETGEMLSILEGHTDWVTSLAFSADDQYLASGGSVEDKTIRLWDFQKEGEIHRLEGHTNSITSLAFLPEQPLLVSSSFDCTVRVWNILKKQEVIKFKHHTNWIYSVALAHDNSFILSGHNDHTVRLWDLEKSEEVLVISGHEGAVSTVAFHPNGLLIASGSWDNTVRLWDATNGQLIRSFKGHQDWLKAVAFSPDGHLLATASNDATVRLWTLTPSNWFWRPNYPVKIFKGHSEAVSCLAFSPSGQIIATGSYDQTIRLWEVTSGQELLFLEGHTHHIEDLVFTNDGQFLLSASSDKTIRLWSLSSGETLYVLRGHTRSVKSIAISPDGQWLVSGGADKIVRLWSLSTQKTVKVFQGHTHQINSLDFSSDGKTFVSADHDGVIRLWEI